MRLVLPVLAVVLLGASLTRLRPEPATVHVRWTVHYWDVTASGDEDVPALRESETNAELFPRSAQRPPEPAHQRVRIVVSGRTLFDRALTRDEIRRLGDVLALHVASDVRFAGPRDLAAGGTAMLQYRASPPGYQFVNGVVAPKPARGFRRADCDRKGSFELERSASHAGTTARIVQRGASFSCTSIRPNSATVEITSSGRTAYVSRPTMTEPEESLPPDAVGALFITDGPTFVDLQRTGKPSIVLTGVPGGAHYCGYRTHLFYPSAAHAYQQAVHTWGHSDSYPALLRNPDGGAVVFGSSIDDFAWRLGARNAVAPVQIFAFESGRFRNVTPNFPAVVGEQADRIWKRTSALLRTGKVADSFPGVIAYLIDMSALRRSAEGWRNVRGACASRDCAGYLDFVRRMLRDINSRASSNPCHK